MVRANADNLFGLSDFIVDTNPAKGSYISIQSAITAATAPAIVYIRPGIYVEDLTLKPGVDLQAVGAGSSLVTITGEQTLTLTGTVNMSNITFLSTGPGDDCIQVLGAAAQSPVVNLFDCTVTCSSGGGGRAVIITGGTISSFSATDCIIQTTGGATGACIECGASGTASVNNSIVTSSAAQAFRNVANNTSYFEDCVITGITAGIEQATAAGSTEVYNSRVTCLASEALNFSAAGSIVGQGNIYLCNSGSGDYATGASGNYTFGDERNIGTSHRIAPGITLTQADWKPYATTTTPGTSRYNPSDFTVNSSTAEVSLAGSGNVTWVTTAVNVSPMVVETGYFCQAPGGALTLALPTTSVLGDTVKVSLAGATSWQITQAAGQQIIFGNSSTTVGVGGSLASSAQGDSVELVCRVANLAWVCQNAIGNLTVT